MMNIKYKSEIIEDIRNKKDLKALDEDFVNKKLDAFFSDIHNNQFKEKILAKLEQSKSYKQFSKSGEHDFLIKTVRAELRKVYGAFILEDYGKKYKILEKLTKGLSPDGEMDVHKELFALHKSTKERMSHFEEIYDQIFFLLKNHGLKKSKYTVLDLACGLNPLSNIYFRNKIEKYYASDISSQDCEFLRAYFQKANIDSEVFPMDLADEKNYPILSRIKCDICFIFKTLDGLERVQRNITQKLLGSINTEYFAITFPTLTLSGHREIKEHRRLWLEKMLDDLGWKWEKQLIENELLYFVGKVK